MGGQLLIKFGVVHNNYDFVLIIEALSELLVCRWVS
jgi:hypothetical protein